MHTCTFQLRVREAPHSTVAAAALSSSGPDTAVVYILSNSAWLSLQYNQDVSFFNTHPQPMNLLILC